MNNSRLLEIARWEYVQKVKSKAFIVSLILFPIVMMAFGFLPSLLINSGPSTSKFVGLIDSTGTYVEQLETAIESARTLDDGKPAWDVHVYELADASYDSAMSEAEADARGDFTAGFVEVVGSQDDPTFVWRSENLSDWQTSEAVKSAIRSVVTSQRIDRTDVDPQILAEINAPVPIQERKLTDEGESEGRAEIEFLTTFFSGFVGVMLFMILIMTTGQTLVRGLVEEKSNRIMEILVGSAKPSELMWGKLLGLSGLGLTQVLIWGALGGAIALGFASSAVLPEGFSLDLLAPMPVILLYLVLGYVFFAAIFIGVGSLVTTEQEAQLVTQYLTLILVAPIAFSVLVLQDPNAGYIEALSYIPLLTPTLMMLRAVANMPSLVTIVGTSAVLLAATVVTTWMAARIFHTAILMYGKRPTVKEMVRWLRKPRVV